MSHTPGPWYPHPCIGLPDEDWWEIDTLERMPADAVDHPPTGYRDIAIVPRRGNEDEANARLIAAAPDLLAACHAALDYIEDENPGAAAGDAFVAGICDRLRGAAAKARGEVTP